jgi:hypothetical protein
MHGYDGISVDRRDLPYDIHVLGGQTLNLAERIWIRYVDPAPGGGFVYGHATAAAVMAGTVHVDFFTSIKFVPNYFFDTPPPTVTYTMGVHGVAIDPATGVVTTSQNSPISNFIVNVTVANTRTTGSNPDVLPVRINVHNSITSVRLTPATLTVRKSSPGRFGVLVDFDDGAAGDVSGDPGLTWQAVSGPIVFDFNAGRDIKNKVITRAGTPGPWVWFDSTKPASTTGSVSVKLSAVLGGGPTTYPADVAILEGWDKQDIEAEKILGPGLAVMDSVTNVLILSDGFTSQDEFKKASRDMAEGSFRSEGSLPLRLLKNNFNVFRAWLPSIENGTSMLAEVKLTGSNKGWAVESPSQNPLSAVATVNHLLYLVGLPNKRDPVTVTSNKKTDLANWEARWKTLFTPPAAHGDWVAWDPGLTADDKLNVFKMWQDCLKRGLPLENDTAFGIAKDRRPHADEDTEDDLSWNPTKWIRADIDAMLASSLLVIKDPTKAATDPDFQRANTAKQWSAKDGGKDFRFVVTLCNAAYGGTHSLATDRRMITTATSASNTYSSARTPPASNIVRISPSPSSLSPTKVSRAQAAFLHEFGHGFHIGEEYGGNPSVPAIGEDVTDAWNTQNETDLGTPLDASKIEWSKWNRIRAVGIIAGIAAASGGGTDITVGARQGRAFRKLKLKAGDLILLRHRPIMKDGPTTPGGRDTVVFAGVSADLTFKTIVGDKLTVEETVRPADWTAGKDIVFAPVTAGITQAMMMHPRIFDLINSKHLPLNRKAAQCDELAANLDIQKLVTLPAGVTLRLGYHVVGLVDQGEGFNCGIFHPTAYCLMRDTQTMRAYCPVCRYLIVDSVDPLQHPALDRIYGPAYKKLDARKP